MDSLGLGRLEYVDNIHSVWKHEALNFTPWLAENIDVLGQELGLELTVDGVEVPVGDFRLDIEAKDEHGRRVLIENQIEASDHRHLGQLIVYASGIDASVIVWVAARIRDEHRSALEWLNSNTPPTVSFFAAEVGVVRIGDSPRAPVFKLVVEPNDWVRFMQPGSSISSTTRKRMAFFERVFDELAVKYPKIHRPRIQPDNWASFASGPFGNYSVTFSAKGYRVEIYLSMGSATLTSQLYDRLFAEQASIHQQLGFPLEWEQLEGKQASRLAVYHADFSLDDGTAVDEAAGWSVQRVRTLHDALDRKLRRLSVEIKQDAAGNAAT